MRFTVTEHQPIAPGVYCLRLRPEAPLPPPVPGQFVNVQVEGFYLRRPISVCDWDSGAQTLTLIYKIVGQGTARLAQYLPGDPLDALCWLGNGYDLGMRGEEPGGRGASATDVLPPSAQRACTLTPDSCLLVGGGVGTPPLYYLAKELLRAGQTPVAVLGFNTAAEVFYERAFADLCETIVTTADGSRGLRGFVTAALPGLRYGSLYCCGPEPMLRAVYEQAAPLPPGRAQFSFERRMACGFGACMACSCRTVSGYKRVCKDGPVLTREEILWN